MLKNLKAFFRSNLGYALYLGLCLGSGILLTCMIPLAIRGIHILFEFVRSSVIYTEFAAVSFLFSLVLILILIRDFYIGWNNSGRTAQGTRFRWPDRTWGVLLVINFWYGYFWCLRHHMCMCGHMCHEPYPMGEYLFDFEWPLAGLAAAVIEISRRNMIGGVYLFYVALLISGSFGTTIHHHFLQLFFKLWS